MGAPPGGVGPGERYEGRGLCRSSYSDTGTQLALDLLRRENVMKDDVSFGVICYQVISTVVILFSIFFLILWQRRLSRHEKGVFKK